MTASGANVNNLFDENFVSEVVMDYDKPLLEQVYHYDWDFDTYSEWINEPKILTNPVRDIKLFHSPIMESLSMAPWWLIPLAYSPVLYLLANKTAEAELGVVFNLSVIISGFIYWTLMEYVLHRFFFHAEDNWMYYVPKTRALYTFHFLIHGIHHAFPSDRYRLVFPPAPGYLIQFCLICPPLIAVLPPHVFYPFLIGFICGYITYDMIHYYLHHGTTMPDYFRDLKTYHMQHHYKFGKIGYGVSNKLWDIVFGTKIEDKNAYSVPKVNY